MESDGCQNRMLLGMSFSVTRSELLSDAGYTVESIPVIYLSVVVDGDITLTSSVTGVLFRPIKG